MVKRTILAMVLSFAVLLVFQLYLEKHKKTIKEETAPVEKVEKKEKAKSQEEKKRAQVAGEIPEAPVKKETRVALASTKALSKSLEIDTPLYHALLNSSGGGFSRFTLKKYREKPGEKAKGVNLIGTDGQKGFPYQINTSHSNPPLPPTLVFHTQSGPLTLGSKDTKKILFTWKSRGGFEIVRIYTFHGDSYVVDIATEYRNGTSSEREVTPGVEIIQDYTEALKGDKYSFKGLVAAIGSDVKRFTLKKIGKGKKPKASANWIAVDSKYFTLGCIPDNHGQVTKAVPLGEEGISILFTEDSKRLNPGDSYNYSIKAYIGPKESNVLHGVGGKFESVLDYGFFGWIAKPLVLLLKYSNRVSGNYGIDIILLTILIKILFYPLTRKSFISMKKMQEIQPYMKKLKEKYKDDKSRLNQEVMTLYKTYKINPLSGCLPMVLQIPVFFALYKALLVAIELRHSPFAWWINDLSAPEYLFDFHLYGYTLPLRLLPLLMGVSMYFQQKMTPSAGVDPTQQKMMNLLPVVFTFMFWGFPSGLVLYWLVNNIITIGQQGFIMKAKEKVEVK